MPIHVVLRAFGYGRSHGAGGGIGLLCLGLVLLAGCGGSTPDGAAGTDSGTSSLVADLAGASLSGDGTQVADGSASKGGTAAVITEADAEEFARLLRTAVQTNDQGAFLRMLDIDGLLERSWSGLTISSSAKQAFNGGVKTSFIEQGALFRDIRQAVAEGGSFEPLRNRVRDGDRTVIFRLLLNGGGLNYQEFRVIKRPDGSLAADDVHILLSGEWMSETLHRSCLAVASELDRGLFEKLTGKRQLLMKHMEEVSRMVTAERQGNSAEALRIYATLPAGLQSDKNVLLMRFRAASNLNQDGPYMEAMADVRKHLPNDPCASFLSIDYHLLRGEFDEAMAGIEQVDASVGGDAYLHVLRATLHGEQDDLDGMRAAGLAAVKGEPTLVDGYWTMINCENLSENYDEVVRWIKALSVHDPHEATDFIGADGFEDFVASAAFQQWRQSELGIE